MLFSGDDFMFVDYEADYSCLHPKYLTMRMNSKSVFNQSTFEISTVEDYIKSLANDLNHSLIRANQANDYFPLIEVQSRLPDEAIWSGYYSIKPLFKQLVKTYGRVFRAVSGLHAIGLL